jgi:hypothetical protein
MSQIKLVLKSSEVEGIFANVNIVINGNIVQQALQLSETPQTVIINTDILDQNTLYFDLLNHRAIDVNGDGQIDYDNDITMYVTLSEMQVSEDDVNFTQLVPQAAQYTTLKGLALPHVDRQFLLIPPIDQGKFWSMNELMGFTKSRVTEIGGHKYPVLSVQGNQIFRNGVFSQELTDGFYWGQ